eukprot:scaffold8637_cov127-Isochrysis_galbana.AAC.5
MAGAVDAHATTEILSLHGTGKRATAAARLHPALALASTFSSPTCASMRGGEHPHEEPPAATLRHGSSSARSRNGCVLCCWPRASLARARTHH